MSVPPMLGIGGEQLAGHLRVARRIDPVWFYRFVYLGMLRSASRRSRW